MSEILNFSPTGISVGIQEQIYFNIYHIDPITLDNILVLVNGFEIYCTLEVLTPDTLLVKCELIDLYYDLDYEVKIQILTNLEDTREVYSFHTESGVYIRSNYLNTIYRSSLTQTLANTLNDCYAKNSEWSLFQRLLNPYATLLENKSIELNQYGNDHFLATLDIRSFNKLYQYILPANQSFRQTNMTGDFQYIIPTVQGYDRYSIISVQIANSLKTLIEDLVPNRFKLTEYSSVYEPIILGPTITDEFPLNLDKDITVPGHIYIQSDHGSCYTSIMNGERVYFSIILTGQNRYGQDQTERIVFIRDQLIQTANEWSHIDTVSIIGEFNIGCEIIILNSPISSYQTDPNILNAMPDRTSTLYWKLDSQMLTENVMTDSTIYDVLRDNTPNQIVRRYILSDIYNQPFVPQAFTLDERFLYVINSDYLYLYKKLRTSPNTKPLLDTQEVDYELNYTSEFENCIVGEEIELTIDHIRATKCPVRYRLYVSRPDNTIEQITGGWVLVPVSSYTFIFPDFDYTLSQTGTYIFTCEVQYDLDNSIETTQQLIDTSYKQAIVQYKLSSYCEPEDIFFDSDFNLFIKSDKLYQVDFYKDYMLIDYEANTIYFNERYDLVEVNNSGTN